MNKLIDPPKLIFLVLIIYLCQCTGRTNGSVHTRQVIIHNLKVITILTVKLSHENTQFHTCSKSYANSQFSVLCNYMTFSSVSVGTVSDMES